eukprot:gene12366-15112_t
MDSPKGLLVPVVRDVQDKSLAQIARDLEALQQRAAQGSLTEAQLSGGTFTVSNIGAIAGLHATPLLVVPQVAILALGRMHTVPRYVNSKTGRPATPDEIDDGQAELQPSHVMGVSMSADHRVVDGATVARFCNSLKRLVEHPALMLAHL